MNLGQIIAVVMVIILLAIIVYILVSYIFFVVAYSLIFSRVEDDERTEFEKEQDFQKTIAEYPYISHSFQSGDNKLQGYLYGARNSKGLIVFVHGLWNSHRDYIHQILYLVDAGWQVFTYDATGSGASEGKSTIGLIQSALDLDAALNYLEESKLKDYDKFLVGHSWGGYAVSAVLNFKHKIAGVISISGYAKPVDMMMETARNLLKDFAFVVRPYAYLANLCNFGRHHNLNAIEPLKTTDIPVMIIHGAEDEIISSDGASIFSYRHKIDNPEVHFMRWSIEGTSGHGVLGGYNYEVDVEQVVDDLAADFSYYLDDENNLIKDKLVEDINNAIVKQNKEEKYKLNVRLMRIVNYLFDREYKTLHGSRNEG